MILCLVVVLVATAALAFNQLRADRDSVREAGAVAAADGLVDALARQAVDHRLDGAALRAQLAAGAAEVAKDGCAGPDCDSEAVARANAALANPVATGVDELLTTVAHSSGGYCAGDGTLLVARSSRNPALRARLLPADFDLASTACANAGSSRAMQHLRRGLPHDLLLVSARAIPVDGAGESGLVAWSLTRLPPLTPAPARRGPLLLEVGSMTLVCLLLVMMTLDGWRTLRRGTGELETALVRLRADLRADIPLPRAAELARVAGGLRAMAAELADTRSRERALERRLDHEQRLAGLGRVVAGVAHEVRNPITGIKLKLDGLMRRGSDAKLDAKLDDRSRADVEICLEEIARLDRVVSSLLLVARKAPTAREPLQLEQLVDERIRQAAALASARHIRVQRSGSAHIDGNREVLTAVIDNLLRNAVEASPDGGAVDLVVVRAGKQLHLEVRDDGRGIPPERFNELFEPFFTTKSSGTGLGLFLSRSLLTAQGAQLSYRREHDRTIFAVGFAMEPS
ncbi:MAG TPA: ATP-binding protein [Polyangia bacterium]|nr:ATP-binding protein [Polyangia bacterium]